MSAVHVRHIRCLRSRQRMCLCRVLSVSVLGVSRHALIQITCSGVGLLGHGGKDPSRAGFL